MVECLPKDGKFMPKIAEFRRLYARFFENRNDNLFVHKSEALNFPLHLHQQLEIFYVTKGKTKVAVRKEEKVLSSGDIAVIFPNHIHSYSAQTSDNSAVLIICDLSYTGIYRDILVKNHPANPFVERGFLHKSTEFIVSQIISEKEEDENSAVYGPLIQLLLARLFPELRLHKNRSEDHEEISYKIAQYVNGNFQDNINLSMLAKELGISKYRLSHIFSEKIGESFTSYLSGIRCSFAAGQLKESDKTVTEIAEEAGFSSQRTFFRSFKENYNLTPKEYRNSGR